MAISFYPNFSVTIGNAILNGVQNASADFSKKYDTAWGVGSAIARVENATPIATMNISCIPGLSNFNYSPPTTFSDNNNIVGRDFSISYGNGAGAKITKGYINSSSLKVSVGSLPIATIGVIGTEFEGVAGNGSNTNNSTIDNDYSYLPKNFKVGGAAVKSFLMTTTIPYSYISSYGSKQPSFIYLNDIPKTIVQVETYSATSHVAGGGTYNISNFATNFIVTNIKTNGDIGSIGTVTTTYESQVGSTIVYSL